MTKSFSLKILTALTCLCLISNVIPTFKNEAIAATDNNISDNENTTFYYIDTNGDNNNDGSFTAPLKDLYGLKDKLVFYINNGLITTTDITVILNEGSYVNLDTSIDFSSISQNNKEYNITFIGNGNVNISGGKKLDNSNFIKENINGLEVYSYDLSNLNIDFDPNTQSIYESPQLYINNTKMQLAKYPNEGFNKISEIVDKNKKKPTFTDNNLPDNFISDENTYIFAYPIYAWKDYISKINIDNKNITLLTSLESDMVTNRNYYIFNNLSLLDYKNEYYIDYTTKKLYITCYDYDINNDIYLSLNNHPLLQFNNCSNITFENITFEYSNNILLDFDNSSNIVVNNCIFRNCSKNALVFNNSSNSTIKNNTIYNTGNMGIYFTGGDRATLTPSNSIIESNNIYNCAQLTRFQSYALYAFGVGIEIKDNKVHDTPYIGIVFKGNNFLIENNNLYNLCSEAADVGGIYSARDWTYRGNIIKENYVHDLTNNIHISQVVGIYLDDCMSSAEVYDNHIENVKVGMLFGGGRDMVIHNNTIKDCNSSLVFDDRALTWRDSSDLIEKLKKIDISSLLWSTTYPDILSLLYTDPRIPYNNTIYDNILINSPEMRIARSVKLNGNVQ